MLLLLLRRRRLDLPSLLRERTMLMGRGLPVLLPFLNVIEAGGGQLQALALDAAA